MFHWQKKRCFWVLFVQSLLKYLPGCSAYKQPALLIQMTIWLFVQKAKSHQYLTKMDTKWHKLYNSSSSHTIVQTTDMAVCHHTSLQLLLCWQNTAIKITLLTQWSSTLWVLLLLVVFSNLSLRSWSWRSPVPNCSSEEEQLMHLKAHIHIQAPSGQTSTTACNTNNPGLNSGQQTDSVSVGISNLSKGTSSCC